MSKKYFIDRFTDNTYTISNFDGNEYTSDVAFVNNYHKENPDISFTNSSNLEELKLIYDVVSAQQKDIEIFGVMLTELNNETKD
jgi:hypothetical protein